MTPLHEAMRRGDRSVVEELLTFGAKPELTVTVGYGVAKPELTVTVGYGVAKPELTVTVEYGVAQCSW